MNCKTCRDNKKYYIAVCPICGLKECGHSYDLAEALEIDCPDCSGKTHNQKFVDIIKEQQLEISKLKYDNKILRSQLKVIRTMSEVN